MGDEDTKASRSSYIRITNRVSQKQYNDKLMFKLNLKLIDFKILSKNLTSSDTQGT